MLSKEVVGWRILAVLLLVLIIPVFPEIENLEQEWSKSINPQDQQPSNNSDSLSADNTIEPENDDDTESAKSDSESASAESSEDEMVLSDAEDAAVSNPPENENQPIESNPINEWILPATQIIVITMMAIMGVALLSSTTIAVMVSESARFSILLAIFGPLISLTQRGEKGVFTRGRILGFIEAHPGIHFSALRDALGLGNGVTAHHINILEKEGRIITWIDNKVRRFATSAVDQQRLKDIQSPATGMQIAILEILSESDNLGIKSGDLRVKLQTTRQLLSYHMKQLKDRGKVTSEGKGKSTRWMILDEGKSLLKNSAHLNDI